MDLSEQIKYYCSQLEEKQRNIPKLYRHEILTNDEITDFKNNIGNLISINGYLSLYSEYSIPYNFARKLNKIDSIQRALFEYQFDLNVVEKIFIADVKEFVTYPEQVDFLVDIGKNKNCVFNYIYIYWFFFCSRRIISN